MAKIYVNKSEPIETDPKKEIKRQIALLDESDFKTVNPVKYESRMIELKAKLGALK